MSQVDLPAADDRPAQTIARNLAMLMVSQVSTWGLAVAGTVIIPRYLGAELIGRFHLAVALWAIGFTMIDFGMDLSLTKAMARNDRPLGELLAGSIAAKGIVAVPVAAGVFGYALLAGYSNQLLVLLAILGIGTLSQAVSGSIVAILRGLDRMGPISTTTIIGRAVFVLGALLLLALGYSVYAVAVVAVTAHLVTQVILWWVILRTRRSISDAASARIRFSVISELMAQSAPYLVMSLSIVVYRQIDTIVISVVVENDAVLGWYSVYDRLAGTLMFIPMVFMTAVYPTLSRRYADLDSSKPVENDSVVQKTLQVMLLLSVPLGFGLATISHSVIDLLYGNEFAGAAEVVAVGGVVISLTYLSSILGMFLISMDRQRLWGLFIGAAALATIPLDIVLVPYFQSRFENGAIGGVVAYGITETAMVLAAVYLLPTGTVGRSSVGYGLRAILAGVIMVAAIYPFRSSFFLLPVALGAVVYGAVAIRFKLVTQEDRKLLASVLPGFGSAG